MKVTEPDVPDAEPVELELVDVEEVLEPAPDEAPPLPQAASVAARNMMDNKRNDILNEPYREFKQGYA